MPTTSTNTTNNNPGDIEFIRQEVLRIGVKIDNFPVTYVTRLEYTPWSASVEKRFDEVDRRFDDLDKLKQEGAKWTINEREKTNAQIQGTEQRLTEKLDEVKKEAQSFKVLMLINILALVAIPVLLLLANYLLTHH